MSEALSPAPAAEGAAPAAPATDTTTHPEGGAPASSPATDASPTPEASAGAGSETASSFATGGADSLGADTQSGADTVAGAETSSAIDPASYEFALPEGYEANDALMASARETFAKAGVPKDAAQPLIDLFASALTEQQSAAQAIHQSTQAEWIKELNALPEFKGPTRATSLTALARAAEEYGSPEVRQALLDTGFGNFPPLVKMMLKMAQALDEGAPASAPRPLPNGKDGKGSKGSVLSYPNTPELN